MHGATHRRQKGRNREKQTDRQTDRRRHTFSDSDSETVSTGDVRDEMSLKPRDSVTRANVVTSRLTTGLTTSLTTSLSDITRSVVVTVGGTVTKLTKLVGAERVAFTRC